jgi:hypothetical protein
MISQMQDVRLKCCQNPWILSTQSKLRAIRTNVRGAEEASQFEEINLFGLLAAHEKRTKTPTTFLSR